jgi:hypothetical protein
MLGFTRLHHNTLYHSRTMKCCQLCTQQPLSTPACLPAIQQCYQRQLLPREAAHAACQTPTPLPEVLAQTTETTNAHAGLETAMSPVDHSRRPTKHSRKPSVDVLSPNVTQNMCSQYLAHIHARTYGHACMPPGCDNQLQQCLYCVTGSNWPDTFMSQ